MTTVATNAPDAYDYGYTTTLHTVQSSRYGTVRIVNMPADRVRYQCDRYESGPYIAVRNGLAVRL